MKIQILGAGCQRCEDLYRNAVEAVKRVEGEPAATNVEKVVDPEVFFRFNVYVTPALVIDEKVISSGKSLTVEQIEGEILKHRPGA
ncbi:MAG: thioredoxin family protein [Deltaproteobacteria bacterium]|nr:thioredoxin family protein [Deltaproteobacteria bacterium]